MTGTRMTITEEVSTGAWSEAAMLVRHVLEHEHDLDGFHKLERQVQSAWMPQALACLLARLLTELADAKSMPPADLLTLIMNSGLRYGP